MKRWILFSALMVAFQLEGLATNYFVDKTASGASNSNNGRAATTGNGNGPWLTIAKCASTMVAGDTCNIVAGSYDERVTVSTSGTSGSRIQYLATAGVIVRGFTVSGNFITIQGFEFTNINMTLDFTRSIDVSSTTGVWILNNNIHDTPSNCIRFSLSTSWIVRNNTASLCGELKSIPGTTTGPKVIVAGVNDMVSYRIQGGASNVVTLTPGTRTSLQICADVNALTPGVCIAIGAKQEVQLSSTTLGPTSAIQLDPIANDAYTALGFTVGTGRFLSGDSFLTGNGPNPNSDGLIEGNSVSLMGDFVTLGDDSRVVIRNNTFGPADPFNSDHIDGLQTNGTNGGKKVLFEGNFLTNNNNADNHVALFQRPADSNLILRYNSTFLSTGGIDCTRSGNTTDPGLYFYNNTFVGNAVYNNAFAAQIFCGNATNNLARNNIWQSSSVVSPYDPSTTIDKDYDVFCCGTGNPSETHSVNSDPLLVDAVNGDFHLRSNSPAIHAGGPLTTVAGTDSGSGTTLVVVNANMFQDGWAGVNPDCIAVGTSTNNVCIASINYATNTITLAASTNRSAGQPIWLFRNSSGAKVMYSTAPDAGAFPTVEVTLRVETAADGSGTVVPLQNVPSGVSITGFAIQRDASGNFVANIAATWSLTSVTGGVVSGDLVPAADTKSAVFTGHALGTAQITATAGSLTANSGVVTVTQAIGTVTIETAANGTGSVVAVQNVASGSTVTGFAIQRDLSGAFIANVAGAWSLTSVAGGIVNGDLVPAADNKSAVFTGHVIGSAKVRAISGGLTGDSGVLTVVAGAGASVSVETQANGTGAVIAAQNVSSGAGITGFSIQRDASGNFVSNVAATWSLANITGGVVGGDLAVAADTKSAVFTGHVIGTATLRAVAGFTGNSGTLTVIAGPATTLGVETAANGSGAVVAAQNVASNSTVTGFSVQRDASGNFVANVAATWSLTSITGGVVAGDLVPAVDNKSAVFTSHVSGSAKMTATAGALTGNSGTLTAIASTVATVTVETAANGTGTVIGTQNLASGSTVTGFAIQRDGTGNFIANAAATWSLGSVTGGVVIGDLAVAADTKSAVFTGHVTGTARITATAGALSGNSGTLTVIAGPAATMNVETAANGSGAVLAAQTVVSNSSVTGFGIWRDISNNFVANVASTWSLTSVTGGVVNGDLVPSADTKSAVFTGHAVGTAKMTATAATLTGSSGTLTVTALDTIAPTVSITAPLNGLTVSGSITITATAADNVGVAGVQFKVDGNSFGLERTIAPYSIIWDTTAVSNAQHILTAVARDAAGNQTTATAVVVTVDNGDRISPTVTLTSPSGTVSGPSVTISADASDNVGVVAVQFKVDALSLGEVATAPYSVIWNTLNTSNGAHTISAIARDAAGNQGTASVTVTVSNQQATTLVTIPVNGGASFETTDTSNTQVAVSYATIESGVPTADAPLSPTAEDAATGPTGVAIIGLRTGGVLVTEAGVPAAARIAAGRIYAEIRGAVNTGIAIANPNPQDAVITFNFTDSTGRDFGQGSTTLRGGRQMAAFLNQPPFNGPSDFQGTFTFRSTTGVTFGTIALRGLVNERGEFLITTLPVAPLTSGQKTAILPQFADGGGWTTQVILTNATETPETGNVQFYGQGSSTQASLPLLQMTINGVTGSTFPYSIPPRSMVRLVTAGNADSPVQVGSVVVTSAANTLQSGFSATTDAPSAVSIFSFRNQGVTVSEASSLALPTGQTFRLYAEASGTVGQTGSIQSGLAVANPSLTSPVTITLELYDLTGKSAGLSTSIVIPAGGQVSRFINELFPALGNFKGIAKVSAPAAFALTALRGRYNERGDFLITTTPPLNETVGAPAGMLFPHIVSGLGYTTQIVVFGPAGSSRLFLVGQDGTLKTGGSLK